MDQAQVTDHCLLLYCLQAVGKAHTWEELSSGEDLKQKRAQLQQEAEDNFAAQYTFRPQFTTDPVSNVVPLALLNHYCEIGSFS